VQLAAGAALLAFYPLPSALSLETITWMIASSILVAATYYLFYASVKSGSLARVIPALYVYPLLTLVFAAAFLGENVTQIQAFGIMLIVAGVTLTALRSKRGKIELRSGIALMLCVALAVAAINVIEKYVLGFVNPWTMVGFTGIVMGALVVSTLAFKKTRDEVAACAKRPKFAFTAVANEIFAMASYVTTAFALQASLASLVAPITAVRPIIVLALSAAWGWAFPKHAFEKLSLRKSAVKIAGAVIVAVGAALVLS